MTPTSPTTPTTPTSPKRSRRKINPAADLSRLRRDQAQKSLRAFALTYLPGHFRLPPSKMHEDLFELLTNAEEGTRLALAAPRGHAKSTLVSLAFLLWGVCYAKERFIVLISDTQSQAIDLLATAKGELESNDRLRTDFPEACELAGVKPAPERWRRDDIVTRNGVRVRALGVDQRLRGRRSGEHRPTLIILDDAENEDSVRSEEQRARLLDWFRGTVLKAGTSLTKVIVAGTVLHRDSLLATLLDERKSPSWTRKCYRAVLAFAERQDLWDKWGSIRSGEEAFAGLSGVDGARAFFESNRGPMLQGTEVLWPEREDYVALMAERLDEGILVFCREKQNEPGDSAAAVFVEEDFHFWDDQFESVEQMVRSLGYHGRVVAACDPSLGKAGLGVGRGGRGGGGGGGDPSAIIVLVRDAGTKKLYVVDADIRRRTPDQIIDSILQLHTIRRFYEVGVETVQFQEFLKTELERRALNRGLGLKVRGIPQSGDKLGRIQSLQPLLTTGRLMLSRRHTTLLDQLRQFPTGRYDDGPDALEMAVRIANRPQAMVLHAVGGAIG